METRTNVITRKLVYLFFIIIAILIVDNNLINNKFEESQKNVKLLSNELININNYNKKLEDKNNSLIIKIKKKNKEIDKKNNIIEEKNSEISELKAEIDKYKSLQTKPNNSAYSTKSNNKNVLNTSEVKLSYSKPYKVAKNPLTASKGVVYFNGHKETYYSEKVLPGNGLNIPGRHVAEDGTIRDSEGYIVISSDLSYASKGSTLMTSLGPAKVYDTGCAYGTLDIYVSW